MMLEGRMMVIPGKWGQMGAELVTRCALFAKFLGQLTEALFTALVFYFNKPTHIWSPYF